MAVPAGAVNDTARAVQLAAGWAFLDPDLVTSAQTIWGLIDGHLRGRGLPESVPVPEDLRAVAVAATLRLAPNPAQRVSESTTSESGSARRVEGSFAGWTLTERMVLDRYRRRVR